MASRKEPLIAFTLDFVFHNVLGYSNFFAVRHGNRVSKFPACDSATSSVLCLWRLHVNEIDIFEADSDCHFGLQGHRWTGMATAE